MRPTARFDMHLAVEQGESFVTLELPREDIEQAALEVASDWVRPSHYATSFGWIPKRYRRSGGHVLT